MPNTFLHWEDFGRDNARRILERYQNELCTFNDDMQGTAVVAVSALLTAMERINAKLSLQRIVILGAGTAGVGIADRLVDSMKRQDLSEQAAIDKIWLVDRAGLLTEDMPDLLPFQRRFARKIGKGYSLEQVVKAVKPTILIGCSAVGGAFTETIVRFMSAHTEQPIILPLSNPNAQSEAIPSDLLLWSNNKALIATGSPFDGTVAQCNNIFSFPGIGLGLMASRAKRLTENMLWVACQALSSCAPKGAEAPLLPPLSEARAVALKIAAAVIEEAKREGVAQIDAEVTAVEAMKPILWEPYYREIRPKKI